MHTVITTDRHPPYYSSMPRKCQGDLGKLWRKNNFKDTECDGYDFDCPYFSSIAEEWNE
jgi:hypothetical protein